MKPGIFDAGLSSRVQAWISPPQAITSMISRVTSQRKQEQLGKRAVEPGYLASFPATGDLCQLLWISRWLSTATRKPKKNDKQDRESGSHGVVFRLS